MLFDLPLEYVLGMIVWLVVLAVSLVALLKLRRRSSAKKSGRVRWINAGLSLWIFLAGLTAIELYVAILFDESDGGNLTKVSEHWFQRHVDADEKIMKFGDGGALVYRDGKEFPRTIRPGQHHICFVGDSFTFGHGIPRMADRFSDRVRASLERKRPGKFVVSNLAEVGRDLQWAEWLLKRMVLSGPAEFPVQTFVLTVCLNDLETFESNPVAVNTGWKVPDFFVRDTYFLNLAYVRLHQIRTARPGDYDSALKASYESEPWEQMRAKFDDLRRVSAEGGIDLRIVIFPFVHNLGPDYPFRDAHRRIAEHCREIGLPVLDLLPVLEPHAKEGLKAGTFDVHPNERANELAAEAIERDLLGDLLDK